MIDISTRMATLADTEVIYLFACNLTEKLLDKALFRQCYEACLNTPNTFYVVATCNEAPVGYISCHGQIVVHHCGMVFEIMELYVMPEYRNLSVGMLLIEALEIELSMVKYELLIVTSNMRRTEAHRFYEANGFTKSSIKFKKSPVLIFQK